MERSFSSLIGISPIVLFLMGDFKCLAAVINRAKQPKGLQAGEITYKQ